MKKRYFLIFLFFLSINTISAQNQFLAEIRIFTGNFAPKGWAFCNGQLLPISQNTALFSLLGTTYGGDGKSTFALPDLRERVVIAPGQGPGLSLHDLGEINGESNVTLLAENLPPHDHVANIKVSSGVGTSSTATSANSLAAPVQNFNGTERTMLPYNELTGNITTSSSSFNTGVAGSSSPLNIDQPYLVCNYIIALQGIFPQRQ
jgi:microcystin-dependent protein